MLERARQIVGAAEYRLAGFADGEAFRTRIEPSRAGLVDVEIDEVAVSGGEGGQHARHIADHEDAVILAADIAQEAEGRWYGHQPAICQVAAQRTLDVAP